LRHLNQSVVLPDRTEVRGMLQRVGHLVSFEELPDEPLATAGPPSSAAPVSQEE
jgi:hypothetical protein